MPPKQKTDNTAMRELKQALKDGQPGRLYLFHGEEAYLREYYDPGVQAEPVEPLSTETGLKIYRVYS